MTLLAKRDRLPEVEPYAEGVQDLRPYCLNCWQSPQSILSRRTRSVESDLGGSDQQVTHHFGTSDDNVREGVIAAFVRESELRVVEPERVK